jgi:hypothetical protein
MQDLFLPYNEIFPYFSPEIPRSEVFMIRKSFTGLALLLFPALAVFSQTPRPTPAQSRIIVVGSGKSSYPSATPTPVKLVVTDNLSAPRPTPTPFPRPVPTQTPSMLGNPSLPVPIPTPTPDYYSQTSFKSLSFSQIKSKIAEAKRQMQSRPMPTSMTDVFLVTDFVRIAFYDWKTQQIDYLVLTKEAFLNTKFDAAAMSANGKLITVHTIRGNGVNTPVVLRDGTNQFHLPLLVQYPVVRDGRYMETAYYMSTHPGLVNPEVVNAGKLYVRNTIEIARDRLRERGINIQPKIADMAERLALVEHVDHLRFRTEYHPNIYNDVFTLYALNEGQTYRYSVSSAGAGGLVQMIPPTYRMIRSRYFNVNLMPDFVEGMRNHVNASQAMLLYMQMTWDDLIASPTVSNALFNKIATPEQLMAAGYNSNPAKLAGYINRGGAGWTSLIPRETQIYLQIFDSIERFVPMTPRTR